MVLLYGQATTSNELVMAPPSEMPHHPVVPFLIAQFYVQSLEFAYLPVSCPVVTDSVVTYQVSNELVRVTVERVGRESHTEGETSGGIGSLAVTNWRSIWNCPGVEGNAAAGLSQLRRCRLLGEGGWYN